jgi:hypothetical protein
VNIDASAVRGGGPDSHTDWMIEIGHRDRRIPLADCRTTEQADLVLAMFADLPPDRQEHIWYELERADDQRPFSRIMRASERTT